MLRTVAGYAELRGKLCVPHHGGNGVGVAAHLQLSAASPNSPTSNWSRSRRSSRRLPSRG
jgi:L-alanine-DL-glutamate epimerase-like enolase superfamily enzyme